MTPADFRTKVLDGLRGAPEAFSFSTLVAESGVSAEVATKVTRSIFAKYVSRLIEDCDYTPAEQKKAASLAQMLELPEAEASQIETRAREALYREELLAAQADGVVTDEEEATLYQLRVQLGLPVVNLREANDMAHAVATSAAAAAPTTASTPAAAVQASGAVPFSAETLEKTGVYKSTNTAAGVLWELAEVKRLDKEAESRISRWTGPVVLSVLALIGALIWCFVSAQSGDVGVAPLVLLGLSVGGFIFSMVKKNSGQADIEDHRYFVMQDLVRFLACDMADDQLLKAFVDFGPYNDSKNLTDEGGGMFSGVKTRKYGFSWANLKGRLLDGTRFRLEATRLVKRKEKSKRKYTKVTENFSDRVDLTLAVRPKNVPFLQAAADRLRVRSVYNGLTIRQVKVQDNKLMLQAMTPPLTRVQSRYNTTNPEADRNTINHHQLLGLFLACYDSIGRAKKKGPTA